MKLGRSQIIWMWHWMSWLSWPSPWNWPSLWNWDALGQTWPWHLFFGQVWHNWCTWHVWVTWHNSAWLDRVGQVAPSPMSSSWYDDEKDYYITTEEIYRIRKEVLRVDIWLDANDAHSTQIWVDRLWLQGIFIYYKDKWVSPLEGSDLASSLFALYIQTPFQKDTYKHLGNQFLGINMTHNIIQYKGILLFTLIVWDNWGYGM